MALCAARQRFSGDCLPLAQEFHHPPLRLQTPDSAAEHLFTAPKRHALQELAVGKIGQAVFESVNAHQEFSARIPGRDFFVRDGPVPEVEGTEPKAVAGPTERAASERFEQSVT